MHTSDQVHLVRCRLSAWILAVLSTLWTGVSVLALRWLQSVSDWSLLGPMAWLSLSLIVIHVALILVTLWVWLHPRPESLIVDARRRSGRGFAGASVIGFAAFWVSGRLTGWLSSLAQAVGVLAVCVAAILILLDIRAVRKLARRMMEEQNASS
jgi:hypothetical protein